MSLDRALSARELAAIDAVVKHARAVSQGEATAARLRELVAEHAEVMGLADLLQASREILLVASRCSVRAGDFAQALTLADALLILTETGAQLCN